MIAEPDPGERAPSTLQLCRNLSERSPQPMVAVAGASHVVVYVNPAFARLVGKEGQDLVGRPFAEAVPEGEANGCIGLLDRVFRTGDPESLVEQEHRQIDPRPAYWSYWVWAILGADERPAGVMIQVTDSTETAVFRRRAVEMNEALLISGTREHERAEAAELLQTQERERAERDRVALLRRLGTAQEDERLRLSRELHDQIGQLLAGLSLGLSAAEDALRRNVAGPDPAARLRPLRRLVEEIGREVHNLALELRPTALDDLGLAAALRNYVENWSARTGVAADFHASDGERLARPAETALYRVVQEALNNVLKHSKASQVSVLLKRRDGAVVAIVEDNGVGFDAERGYTEAQARGRLGLLGMRERMEAVGGELDFESSPGGGTTVFAQVPTTNGGANANG